MQQLARERARNVGQPWPVVVAAGDHDAGVAAAPAVGAEPLVDQQLAGALMWALAMVIDSVWMMVAAVEWWRSEERSTELLERREREGVTP